MSSGSTSLEGLSRVGPVTTTASFLDASPEVDFRLPVEIKAGAAWKGTRAQVEVDVLAFTGTGTYDAFTSTETVTVLVDQGAGAPPLVQVYPFRPPVVDSRSVVNVAVGGAYNLSSDGAWVFHGGYATDGSPVGELDTTFTKINLNKITAGVSGRTKYFLGSVGLQVHDRHIGHHPARPAAERAAVHDEGQDEERGSSVLARTAVLRRLEGHR